MAVLNQSGGYNLEITVDSNALTGPTSTILSLFDTLQEITFNDHELHDPAC